MSILLKLVPIYFFTCSFYVMTTNDKKLCNSVHKFRIYIHMPVYCVEMTVYTLQLSLCKQVVSRAPLFHGEALPASLSSQKEGFSLLIKTLTCTFDPYYIAWG